MIDSYKGYAELNPQQRIKCAQFLPYYDEQRSVQLTELLDKAGENSFKRVLAKVHILAIERDEVKAYNDQLYDAFVLNTEVNIATIIRTVSRVRLEMRLAPYTQGLTLNCLNDLMKLFIVKVTHKQQPTATSTMDNPKYRKVKEGYMPVFKLQP